MGESLPIVVNRKGTDAELHREEKPLSNFYPTWLLMVGKTKLASVIHHQRERSPKALEDGPPVRSLIRIRLPSPEQEGVH